MLEINNVINEKNRFRNFAEEVEIVRETKAGDAYSLYSVKNKNNVTFQAVSGRPDLNGKGFLGYINGDRARPTVFGFGVKTEIVATTITLEEFEDVTVTFIPKAVVLAKWDIEHFCQVRESAEDNIVVPDAVTTEIL